jgi:hypothetical protein
MSRAAYPDLGQVDPDAAVRDAIGELTPAAPSIGAAAALLNGRGSRLCRWTGRPCNPPRNRCGP